MDNPKFTELKDWDSPSIFPGARFKFKDPKNLPPNTIFTIEKVIQVIATGKICVLATRLETGTRRFPIELFASSECVFLSK